MRTRKYLLATLFSLFAILLLSASVAVGQDTGSNQDSNDSTVEGTVASSAGQTFVVRSDDSQFHLFVFNRYTTKPEKLNLGARVRVTSKPGTESGTRLATEVAVLEAAPAGQRPGMNAAPVPESVQETENSIIREARRWRLGVRGGVALNPELIFFGVHSQMGPIFTPRLFFRPNAEFAWGEVTDLIALNLEAVYRLAKPVRGKWYPYVGGGPALTFIHQNFQRGRDVDFGNFDFDTGLNILAGLQRGSMFVEAKTSLYASPAPVLRLMVGYNF